MNEAKMKELLNMMSKITETSGVMKVELSNSILGVQFCVAWDDDGLKEFEEITGITEKEIRALYDNVLGDAVDKFGEELEVLMKRKKEVKSFSIRG